MNPVTETQLAQTVAYIQNVIDTYMAAHFPTLPRKVITVNKGKKYAKLVATDTGRYVYGFIDLTNGDLLKAASWKAPALNFPRGNIHANDLACCKEHSIG